MTLSLLGPDEPPAFRVERPSGTSDYVFVCDHASARMPRALSHLGVSEAERSRHIAWDIGIAEVGYLLSQRLDASLVLQNYSRLVIDANRPPGTEQSIVTLSEHTPIPGNVGLSQAAIAQRQREIFEPYHAAIRGLLDERLAAGRPTVLCTLHSFTPTYKAVDRQWHAGVLYNRDARLAHDLLDLLRAEPGLVVGDNQPYAASEQTDYALVVHGERRGLPCVELEVRQDLIEHAAGQRQWAQRLADLLPRAYARVIKKA